MPSHPSSHLAPPSGRRSPTQKRPSRRSLVLSHENLQSETRSRYPSSTETAIACPDPSKWHVKGHSESEADPLHPHARIFDAMLSRSPAYRRCCCESCPGWSTPASAPPQFCRSALALSLLSTEEQNARKNRADSDPCSVSDSAPQPRPPHRPPLTPPHQTLAA